MKKGYLLGLLVAVIGLWSLTSASDGSIIYKLDTKKSKINWDIVDQNEKNQKGILAFKSGNIQFDSKRITGGFFYINVQSLRCTSITDVGFNADLIDWMRSASNLNAIKTKEIKIKFLKATRKDVPDGQDNFTISAQIDIKGLKKTVEFPALVSFGKKATFKTNFVLTATDYNLEKDLKLTLDVLVIKS
tara:strand:+ start:682 stop:1248 length:567 start_codon:yes stop_codon:yes gene_type:complete